MANSSLNHPTRRSFLRAATAAAATGFAVSTPKLIAAPSAVQAAAPSAPQTFQLFTAERLAAEWQALDTAPANKTLVDGGTYTIMYTVETAHSAQEFEWHEGRDHILQIVDGSTVYEVGGTPRGAHSTRPGEWLAPESEGATKMTLKKGDLLVIPRGTPHKRITPTSVTLTLISPMGVKA